MILSRQRPAGDPAPRDKKKADAVPSLEEFIERRDFKGASTLLDFHASTGVSERAAVEPWRAYCAFHAGDIKTALDLYGRCLETDPDVKYHVYRACCLFYLGMYQEAEAEALRGAAAENVAALRNRVLFHLAHKFNDEAKLMEYHGQLQDTVPDQLCLASIHHLRCHYQEATDIYKRLLVENRDYNALNVYIALCYYKLDFFDVSLEVLNFYLQRYPTSLIAVNLKACNQFRLYDGRAAAQELRVLEKEVTEQIDHPLIQHNKVVFAGGEAALKTLPGLIGVIPEARLNLVIYHLRNEEFKEAFELMADVEPTTPPEYILKGIVNAAVGQASESQQHLKAAQQYFNLVGASTSECDTIPGRQCMASCFFLAKQFDDVLIYLSSIESFFDSDDTFLFNIGIAKAAAGKHEDAVAHLTAVQSDSLRADPVYTSWLARCYIHTGRAKEAWGLYTRLGENAHSVEGVNLLQLIGNDSYRCGAWWVAARAFDQLERLDPGQELSEGKIGACVGLFRDIVAGKMSYDVLPEIIALLRASPTSSPEVEYCIRVMSKYGRD
jgi:intraflagellar transport protein 56